MRQHRRTRVSFEWMKLALSAYSSWREEIANKLNLLHFQWIQQKPKKKGTAADYLIKLWASSQR
jgi:hypothetical protein